MFALNHLKISTRLVGTSHPHGMIPASVAMRSAAPRRLPFNGT